MFSLLGLFQNLQCPQRDRCSRTTCIFSHQPDLLSPPDPSIPITEPNAPSSTSAGPPSGRTATIPAKRAASFFQRRPTESEDGVVMSTEPPRKLMKVNATQSRPSTSDTSTSAPVLRVSAAQSHVPIPVRQTMLKSLHDHFVVLYDAITVTNPTLATDHALRQEEEVYKQTSKLTYRNAVITSIAALKRRAIPDSPSHPSVGTDGDIRARQEARKSLNSLRLTREHLEPLLLTTTDMRKWGYIVDIPEGLGGDKPSEEGQVRKCERCSQPFQVKSVMDDIDCHYHWGRPYTKMINGEKTRIYTCCSRPTVEGGGCVHGPHVFYDSTPDDLHSRHPFSRCQPDAELDTALDVVALDCEMIYTTAGMSVARVSLVDGAGKEIFDEMVRMTDAVKVIDYNTRFSGVTEENSQGAILPLSAIRSSLDYFINSSTIVIGHALENDLKTLRLVHDRCVDTAILFPHKGGHPYRRALRDLVKEHLGTLIQTGNEMVGHSSVEDSAATLDLVRWYVLNKSKGRA